METSGPEPHEARIVTASIVLDVPGQLPEQYEWLVNPGIEIPQGAIDVHGVTNERAQADGMPAARAVWEIAARLRDFQSRGIPLVAYNASYDFTVLEAELKRRGHPSYMWGPIIDPHVIDKAHDKYRKGSRKLGDTCTHYGITLENAHTSAADSMAAVQLARALAVAESRIKVTPAQLHNWTGFWKFQQARSLQEYLRKEDPDAVVSTEWPVQTQHKEN